VTVEWFKMEARYHDDKAIVSAGEKAEVLFVRGIAYATDFETSGFIPIHQLVRFGLSGAKVRADAGEDESADASTGQSAACPQNRIYEEGEEELNPLPPSDKPARRKPKTPCPDIFPLTDDLRAWATNNAPHVDDLEAETRKFLAHHRANDSRFVRWNQAWFKWMTTAEGYAKQRQPQNPRFDANGTYTGWDV
jgi:hypothetical protein